MVFVLLLRYFHCGSIDPQNILSELALNVDKSPMPENTNYIKKKSFCLYVCSFIAIFMCLTKLHKTV